jgi:hypothetical protein
MAGTLESSLSKLRVFSRLNVLIRDLVDLQRMQG